MSKYKDKQRILAGMKEKEIAELKKRFDYSGLNLESKGLHKLYYLDELEKIEKKYARTKRYSPWRELKARSLSTEEKENI